jgi:hypothetical protein
MKKKKMAPERQLVELVTEHNERYLRWQALHDEGGSDPGWSDGVNMNLLKNHVFSYKRQMKELCEKTNLDLPGAYFREPLPEMDQDYMARKDEIKSSAIKTFEELSAYPDYIYLTENISFLTKKQKGETCIIAIVGYVQNLKKYIAGDDYIGMRRYRTCKGYLEAITKCAAEVQALPQENVQMCLFA